MADIASIIKQYFNRYQSAGYVIQRKVYTKPGQLDTKGAKDVTILNLEEPCYINEILYQQFGNIQITGDINETDNTIWRVSWPSSSTNRKIVVIKKIKTQGNTPKKVTND